jgi:hypothetical protein
MNNTQYQVQITTQDGDLIKRISDFNQENLSELIAKIEPRADYVLTLYRRFIFGNDYIEMNGGRENLPKHLFLKDTVITPWSILAQVNTQYAD